MKAFYGVGVKCIIELVQKGCIIGGIIVLSELCVYSEERKATECSQQSDRQKLCFRGSNFPTAWDKSQERRTWNFES